ncbi:hypothetical protein [Streptomyces sp. NBRC 110028]|uniref:hypothetical protein n=1 Tax=Streptomyces sp. NBRC 110028 TaxID=1621260 RepID=UPI0006E439FB|nr:hypothetical protein [Streptomyces sp. NBRC 110028]
MDGTAPALRPEDEPDFERVLRQALHTPEIRAALRRHGGSAGGAAAERLRARARAERPAITAAAAPEYGAYLRLRATGAPDVRTGRAPSAAAGVRGLLPVFAVLVPVLAAAATAVFLLLGYVLGLGRSGRELGDALLTAGQTAAVITAVTTAGGVTWLLITAARHRTPAPGPGGGAPGAGAGGAAEAHETWRRALLERGVLPFLREQLQQAAAPRPRPRLGYTSPDYAGPEYTGPGFTGPTPPSQA